MQEKFKTELTVFDNFTSRNLFKLISQGHFEGLTSPLFLGKEANIFTADTKDDTVIVKIYRLSNADFTGMYNYLKFDPRYHTKKNRRKVILTWAQREYRNLLKAREAGVKVPLPITIKENVLVMEFIGDDEPAPKLKDKKPKDPEKFLKKIIYYMKKLHKAGLVHADLSPHNILNHNEQPVFIDFSQATPTTNSQAQDYLERDIINIANHFKKLNIEVNKKELIEAFKKKS